MKLSHRTKSSSGHLKRGESVMLMTKLLVTNVIGFFLPVSCRVRWQFAGSRLTNNQNSSRHCTVQDTVAGSGTTQLSPSPKQTEEIAASDSSLAPREDQNAIDKHDSPASNTKTPHTVPLSEPHK